MVKALDKKTIIGIDPDVDKSGVAIKSKGEVHLMNYTFFELFDYLEDLKGLNTVTVYIECGYLNKGNWHKTNGSNSINAQIGQRTGGNHQVAKLIVQMCQYLEINFVEVKPTRSKVNADFFKQITKIEKRTNQEQRDAYMLIHGL